MKSKTWIENKPKISQFIAQKFPIHSPEIPNFETV